MQKMLRYCLLLGISASLIAVAGCNKLFDYIKDHPDEANTSCKLKKLFITNPFDTITAVVAYNSWGDPISVTPNDIKTGNPQRLFRYDSKHRLTDYIGAYDNGYYEQWRSYVYDSHDRIIRDTATAFGLLDDRYDTPLGIAVTTYEYDSKGRVIHTSQGPVDGSYPPLEFFYSYDSNGNLTGGVYDDKINFNRTNKVWMFVNKNYSVNNRKPVTGYNEKGLPLKVANAGFLSFQAVEMTITYKCD